MTNSAFVADGYGRVLQGIEFEVRSEIEAKYANELMATGIIKRWFIRQKMEREIAECLAVRTGNISPDALYQFWNYLAVNRASCVRRSLESQAVLRVLVTLPDNGSWCK